MGYRLVAVAFSTGVIGGPFEWRSMSANSLADPSDLISLGSWVALGSLVYYAFTTRTASRRAWSLIVFSLAADVVSPGLGTGQPGRSRHRAGVPLPDRVGAIVVLSIGLAFLPLLGALETNRLREGVDRPYERRR